MAKGLLEKHGLDGMETGLAIVLVLQSVCNCFLCLLTMNLISVHAAKLGETRKDGFPDITFRADPIS